MPGVGESRSTSSLFDFFDERKNSKITKDSSQNKAVSEDMAKEEVKQASKDDGVTGQEDIVNNKQHSTKQHGTTSPSDSEIVLIEQVSGTEIHSIRSKTLDGTAGPSNMERFVKSDTAFAPELVSEYPDIEGAGDGSYSIVSNDEGVQIDIIAETGMSEFSDRGTVATMDSQHNRNETEDQLSDNDENRPTSTSSDEDTDSNHDNEGEQEIAVDVQVHYDTDYTDSDDDKVAEPENSGDDGSVKSNGNASRNDELNMEDEYETSDDVNSEQMSESSHYGSESDDEREELASDDEAYRESLDDPSQNRSSCQYDPCSGSENESSDEENMETIQQYEDTEDVNEPKSDDRDTDVISGTRETFTPFEDFAIDDPGEGNRPESNNDINNKLNALHTRINKSDGEVIMRVPLSRSFILRNKDTCIAEGAQTVGELMMALQRKRLADLTQEEDQRIEHRHETNEDEVVNAVERSQNDVHAIEKNYSDSQMSENKDCVRNTDRSQRSTSTNEKGNFQDDSVTHDLGIPKVEFQGISTEDNKNTDRSNKPKKTDGKKKYLKTTNPKWDVRFANPYEKGSRKQVQKNIFVNTKTYSALQSRVSDQYSQKNLRKGSKPVLPAISKGAAREVGQTMLAKVYPSSNAGTNVRRTQPKNIAKDKKTVPRDLNVYMPPVAPLIPVQLRSNACFRNGQLEVEVTCDDRMYSAADPMNVKVTFVHKHVPVPPMKNTKTSAYNVKKGKKSDKLFTCLSSPVNRNVIHQRALWPPFNTHLDREASERHMKIFGSL